MIIDFHTHTFPEKISAKVIRNLALISHSKPFTDGSVKNLISSMKTARMDYSVNLPVMTSPEQVEKINGSMIAERESLLSHGIITFGGMHPAYENYKKELLRLKENHIPGIKLHPAYQNVDLDDIRMMRIIDYASELGMIVITHAGVDIGIYDHNYASVRHVLKIMKEVRPTKFVLAHMGGWACWEEVARDLAGAPLWLDTAFSIGPITPNPEDTKPPILETNLSGEAFVRLARKHGTDKILFGTDCPWQDQADYVARIRSLPVTGEEKEQIFSANAVKLLNMEL